VLDLVCRAQAENPRGSSRPLRAMVEAVEALSTRALTMNPTSAARKSAELIVERLLGART
jgi:hypothetical protein